MSEVVREGKLVELTYKVSDQKTGQVLSTIEYPLGYVHGHNDVLAPQVLGSLRANPPVITSKSLSIAI